MRARARALAAGALVRCCCGLVVKFFMILRNTITYLADALYNDSQVEVATNGNGITNDGEFEELRERRTDRYRQTVWTITNCCLAATVLIYNGFCHTTSPWQPFRACALCDKMAYQTHPIVNPLYTPTIT